MEPEFGEQVRYLAVIGDIAGSRRFDRSARTEIGGDISSLIAHWNADSRVAAAFVVSRGDEFEGLLHAPEMFTTILWDLATVIPHVALRLGVGVGEIYTPLVPETSDEVDGPVYHRARRAIESAATAGHLGGDFVGFGEPWDSSLGAIARALYAQRAGWTAAQRTVAMSLHEGQEQIRIAEQLGVTRQNISKHASAAGWQVHADLEAAFADLLQSAWAVAPRLRLEETS